MANGGTDHEGSILALTGPVQPKNFGLALQGRIRSGNAISQHLSADTRYGVRFGRLSRAAGRGTFRTFRAA